MGRAVKKILLGMLGGLLIMPIAAFRISLWVLGWFYLPLYFKPFYGEWKGYVEMAWRNPTNGMKEWWTQPIKELRPNPDQTVRGWVDDDGFYNEYKYDDRWMLHGIYWEYWYMRQIDWTFRGKHYKWFEFRIGWKFVDGNKEFFPTLQFGPRSS